MVSRYVSNGPVKQEGISLLPPPHYRMMPPQRSDAFPVSTPPSYAPQTQGPNQGPALRAPTVPPNQASTPPNTEIKALNNPMYMQQPIRSAQGTFFPRAAGPPSTTQRMPNQHNRPQQQIYPAHQFLQISPHQMYIPGAMPYFSTPQRPPGFVQPSISMYGTPITSYQSYPAPHQAQAVNPYFFNQSVMPRAPVPQATSAPPNPTQTNMANVAMGQPTQPHPSFQRTSQRMRRPNALSIIDPTTGADKSNEIYECNSHPPSGESSARQTPQLPPQNKEVQAEFAKRVAQAMSADENVHVVEETNHKDVTVDHIDSYPPQQAVHNPRYENIVQSSTLQINAKEFVSSTKTAKETPIVSANSDAAEVIIPSKVAKERESPAKARKHREPPKEHKDVPNKDTNCDKITSVVKEDATDVAITSTNVIPVVSQSKDGGDKRSQKKSNVVDAKQASVEVCENAPVCAQPVSQAVPSQETVSAKSKQNAQRKQGGPQNNQKVPAVIPTPQPTKATSKASKKSEINLKGANKEGTDMDAFNDNRSLKDEVNANVTESNQNDILNANMVQQQSIVDVSETADVTSENKMESNENVTVKPEPTKTMPKAKEGFDVTSIIREVPKSVASFNYGSSVATDETDKAVVSNDKMVLAKNDVNTKINSSSGDIFKAQLKYKEGQWSPANPDGDKVYDREFLLILKNCNLSRRKPNISITEVVADDRNRLNLDRNRTDFTNPPFSNYVSKSGSQRGVLPKRNSQGKQVSREKMSKPVPRVILSLREDVKLHETENAWRPARFTKGANMSEDEKQTEQLYKKVRSVLNKLTPQKFDTLVNQVRSLEIESKERLQGVIDLVFEKAVDEPNFSVAYALMCKELQMLQVAMNTGQSDEKKSVAFRTLLLTRCQVEFEKNSIDESERNVKLKEIEECKDPEKKKDLQFDLEEYDRKLRMKSVGTIRFIGELFKQNMLTASIMKRCLQTLLKNNDEESLECLCKLLTTVGKELESKNVDLKDFFGEMKDIVNGKSTKVSSRIRFMLQDVIELRESKWVPRRQDLNPKTIDQIQKEAESEQMNIQAMNSVPVTPRKDDRMGGGGGGGGTGSRQGRKNVCEEGWSSVGSKKISVQGDKLKSRLPHADEPLGSSQLFAWGKVPMVRNPPTSVNIYNTLATIESDKHPAVSRSNKDPYSSKGPSLERSSYNKSYDGRGSRSGSQHRSESQSSSQRSTPVPVAPPPKPAQAPAPQVPALTEEQIERRVNNSLEEYLNDSCSIEEYTQDIISTIPSSYFPRLVADTYLRVIERSRSVRLKTGNLFASLVKAGKLSLTDFAAGLEDVFSQADDLKIDIPRIWEYLAEILVDSICQEVLSIERLHKCFVLLIEQGHSAKVLSHLLKFVVIEKGPNFLQSTWQKSGMQLSDFMPSGEVFAFVKDNNLEFLCGGETPCGETQLTYTQIHEKLSQFLKNKNTFDDIVNWISANVGKRIEDKKFIRTLATAIFEHTIMKNTLVEELLLEQYKLLQKYVDNNPDYELQCLYALQALIHKLEHPRGLLFSIFNKLYEDNALSVESFVAWEASKDPAEMEGKAVALTQLVGFLTQLVENDDEEDDEEASEGA